jgi:hypothetical protein
VWVGCTKVFDHLGEVCEGCLRWNAGPGVRIKKFFQFKAKDEYGAGETYDNDIECENNACPEMNLKVHAPEQKLLRVLEKLAEERHLVAQE